MFDKENKDNIASIYAFKAQQCNFKAKRKGG